MCELMVAIIDYGWNIERQHSTRIRDVANIDVEDHAVIMTYT